MGYLWMSMIAVVAGLATRVIVPGGRRLGVVLTAALGVAGALAASWAGEALGWPVDGEAAGWLISAAGAALAVSAAGRLTAAGAR